jgi:hypothetical protein
VQATRNSDCFGHRRSCHAVCLTGLSYKIKAKGTIEGASADRPSCLCAFVVNLQRILRNSFHRKERKERIGKAEADCHSLRSMRSLRLNP